MEGFGWCQFSNSILRYNTRFKGSLAGAGFFNGMPASSGTLTGSIVPGPSAGSSAIQFSRAHGLPADFYGNTGWYQGVDLAGGARNWIISCWVYPTMIGSRQTFLWLSGVEAPNFLGNCALAVNALGQLEVIHFNGDIVMNSLGTINVASTGTLPDQQWSHVCVRFIAPPTATGRITIWINGSLDNDQSLLGLISTAQINQCYLVWQNNAAGTSIALSNLIICDDQGVVNNGRIAPQTQIRTISPTSDFDNGGWRRGSGVGSNFSMVDTLSGPGGTYITLPNLSLPDQLFGIDPNTDGQILGVGSNFAMTNGPGTIEPLVQIGASRYAIGPSLTAITMALVGSLAEGSPASGGAWTDAEINAAAWGARGSGGSGEQVYQMFLEKLWTTGSVGGSYAF